MLQIKQIYIFTAHRLVLLIFLVALGLNSIGQIKQPKIPVKEAQMKYPRIRTAYAQKDSLLKKQLDSLKVNMSTLNIFLRIFKKESLVEVWVKNTDDLSYKFLKSYRICRKSMALGPKRKESDKLLPEGFYSIESFVPESQYFLSMLINYPNEADKILGSKFHPGGDIAIHGTCLSIGCFAIGDDNIKELYILALESKNNGQKDIAVHIFPARLDEIGFESLRKKYQKEKSMMKFWKNLKQGYDYFEKKKTIPIVKSDDLGVYFFE